METIVAMGIFVILLTLVFANFRQGEKQVELSQSALELADNLRKVQNLGMSGQVTKYCQAGTENEFIRCQEDSKCGSPSKLKDCDYNVPKGGYGIHLAKKENNYTLFVDLSGDLAYDISGIEDDVLPGGGNYPLKGKVKVSDYQLHCAFQVPWDCIQIEDQPLDVLFMPPRSIPWASFGQNVYEEEKVYILLEHTEINKCAKVSVNGFSGDVSTEPDDDCILDQN